MLDYDNMRNMIDQLRTEHRSPRHGHAWGDKYEELNGRTMKLF